MGTQMLDIQPRELRFIFELKKQSSCSIQLLNKSHHHVAFKVKTTSPKKYCVRPNVGIIKPKSTCEFTVTMQAQRSAPPDMSCKDKFLVQSTIVPTGTCDEDITSVMFSKEGKYIEENKLRVSLISFSPPNSPVPSPTNGEAEYGNNEARAFRDGWTEDDFILQEPMVFSLAKPVNSIIKVVKEEESPEKDEIKVVKGKESSEKDDETKVAIDEEGARVKSGNNLLKVAKDVGLEEPYTIKDVKSCKEDDDMEGANLVRDVQQMKLKLSELESKLSQAEVTITKLTAERQVLSTRERPQILKQEPAPLRSRNGMKIADDGFPLLFVVMVALLSLTCGYLLH